MGTTTGEDGERSKTSWRLSTRSALPSVRQTWSAPSGEIDIDAVKDSEDAGQRLLADRTFFEKLDGASYGYNEEGKKVVRVEMDLELEDMLGYDTGYSPHSKSTRGAPSGQGDGSSL